MISEDHSGAIVNKEMLTCSHVRMTVLHQVHSMLMDQRGEPQHNGDPQPLRCRRRLHCDGIQVPPLLLVRHVLDVGVVRGHQCHHSRFGESVCVHVVCDHFRGVNIYAITFAASALEFPTFARDNILVFAFVESIVHACVFTVIVSFCCGF